MLKKYRILNFIIEIVLYYNFLINKSFKKILFVLFNSNNGNSLLFFLPVNDQLIKRKEILYFFY